MKPGTIKMKDGQWWIITALRGFRPRREPLDGRFISRLIRKYFSEYDGTLLSQRALSYWVPELLVSNYRPVHQDMKYRISCMDDCRLKRYLMEWTGWLNYMVMVKSSKSEVPCG